MNHNVSAGSPVVRTSAGTPLKSVAGDPGRHPLARLLHLVMLLQTERCPNARELAEACEVSRRTIYRDLATLAEAGILVNYAPDRQGYQIGRNVFLQPARLLEKEALALLLISRTWDGGGAVGLARPALQAVDKILQGLPPDLQDNVRNCAELLPEPTEGEESPDVRGPLFDGLLAATTVRRQIRLWYRPHAASGPPSEPEATKFSLYRLVRIQGAWTLIGRSSFHRRVIAVPFPWVEKLEPTTDSYEIPPRFDLERFLDQGRTPPGPE